MSAVRPPVAAGTFYPARRADLNSVLDKLWPDPVPTARRAIGVVSPHAGYVYSGGVAARVFASVEPVPVYFLIGPNHTGLGCEVAVAPDPPWRTPLGDVPRHEALARRFLAACAPAREDAAAHAREHALEVVLPFLQRISPRAAVVCVTLGSWRKDLLETVARAAPEADGGRAAPRLSVASAA